jgi:hypothetical protein
VQRVLVHLQGNQEAGIEAAVQFRPSSISPRRSSSASKGLSIRPKLTGSMSRTLWPWSAPSRL